jgi:hypothetical protein
LFEVEIEREEGGTSAGTKRSRATRFAGPEVRPVALHGQVIDHDDLFVITELIWAWGAMEVP